jgi:hypothetical protein
MAKMSRTERDDLGRVARMRLKVAKAKVEQRKKELRADVEAKLSAIYQADHEKFARLTARMGEKEKEWRQEAAAISREEGILERFAPQPSVSWYGRGENASRERRAELRKAAYACIDAKGAAALTELEARTADVLTLLIADGLQSDEAKQFLDQIPTVEQLMPVIDVDRAAAEQMLQQRTGDLLEDDADDDDEARAIAGILAGTPAAAVTRETGTPPPAVTPETPGVTANGQAETASRNTCAGCGQAFTPTRSDAKYCKPACRVADHRRRHKAAE